MLFLLFFITLFTHYLSAPQPYYQIINDYSFNTRNKKDNSKIKTNYQSKFDSLFIDKYQKYILLPNAPNAKGVIQTKNQIDIDTFEIQVQLRITAPDNRSPISLFYLWLYNQYTNIGSGVLFHTVISQRTKMFYFEKVNTDISNVLPEDIIAENYSSFSSCSDYLAGRDVTLFLRLNEKGEMNLYYSTATSLLQTCFIFVASKIPNGLKPPFFFGIGAMNQNEYQSMIEVKKITFFNKNEANKYKYRAYNIYESKKENLIVDLIERYYLKKHHSINDIELLLKDTNSSLSSHITQYNNSQIIHLVKDYNTLKEISSNELFLYPDISIDNTQINDFASYRDTLNIKREQITSLSIMLQNLGHHNFLTDSIHSLEVLNNNAQFLLSSSVEEYKTVIKSNERFYYLYMIIIVMIIILLFLIYKKIKDNTIKKIH